MVRAIAHHDRAGEGGWLRHVRTKNPTTSQERHSGTDRDQEKDQLCGRKSPATLTAYVRKQFMQGLGLPAASTKCVRR